jgi:hypothetical protein
MYESSNFFQLCEQARTDPELSGLLARGPIEAIDPRGDRKRGSLSESDNPIEEIVANKYTNGQIGRILRRDFIVRRTGNCQLCIFFDKTKQKVSGL